MKKSEDKDIMQLFLCRPCAEEMKGMKSVEKLEYIKPAREKGTCEQCRRRRFGYFCKVEFKLY